MSGSIQQRVERIARRRTEAAALGTEILDLVAEIAAEDPEQLKEVAAEVNEVVQAAQERRRRAARYTPPRRPPGG
ncbi:hypothetical protein KYY02_31190 [Streptomyces pimonensis]|uniref:Uncharacterized protein n=1 Tax=Streptomyces pimonensis TaxID=2860288 RepID=A0ABV4J9X6_9ACTN